MSNNSLPTVFLRDGEVYVAMPTPPSLDERAQYRGKRALFYTRAELIGIAQSLGINVEGLVNKSEMAARIGLTVS